MKRTRMKSLALKIAGPIAVALGGIGAVVLMRRRKKGLALKETPAHQPQDPEKVPEG